MGTERRRLWADGASQARGRVTAVLTTCALLTLVGGCTRTTGADEPSLEGASWAAPAEAYVAAFDTSWSEGVTNAIRFYAPEVRVDQRGLLGRVFTQRAPFAQSTRDAAEELPVWTDGRPDAGTLPVVEPLEPPYLSTTGMVHPTANRVSASYPMTMASTFTIGPAGITQEEFAGNVRDGERYTGQPYPAISEPIVTAYLAAWSAADPAAVRSLYAPTATLLDSINRTRAEGSAAIAALATTGAGADGLPGATLHAVTEGQPPVWYANGPFLTPAVDMLILLLDIPGQCPGPVAVQLRLDERGRIVREERFHRVDALERCRSTDDPPHGWWDIVTLPRTPPVQRTGSVRIGTHDIAVWNGSGHQEGLLRWAAQRFAGAGLASELPSSVTFLPDVPDAWDAYGFVSGSNAADIGVPATAADPCSGPSCTWSAAGKHAILHELAHLWLTPSPYYGPPDRSPARRMLRHWAQAQGLPWDDQALPWEQRAGERAAEILAWGLMDQRDRVDARLGNPSCGELARDFEALTLTTADPRACVPGEGGAP